jgi:hypothetical protein
VYGEWYDLRSWRKDVCGNGECNKHCRILDYSCQTDFVELWVQNGWWSHTNLETHAVYDQSSLIYLGNLTYPFFTIDPMLTLSNFKK